MTILERIHENAITNPDRYAYITELYDTSGDVIEQKLTWRELELYSSRLAGYIESACPSKKPVIVYGHKNPLMLVSMLACVKSGRAYCPVDVSVPDSRVKSIIDVVEPDLVVATESLLTIDEKYPVLEKTKIEFIVNNEALTVDSCSFVKDGDIFYIIFTSGSTGVPKGVQITRECLDNFIKWIVKTTEAYINKKKGGGIQS